MRPGEYRFGNGEFLEINKPLVKGLYASVLYHLKDKWVLEVLAPCSMMKSKNKDAFSTPEEERYNVGEEWGRSLRRGEEMAWPLENCSYYIEVNGKTIGDCDGSETYFRHEPEKAVNNEDDTDPDKTLYRGSYGEFGEAGVLRTELKAESVPSVKDSLDKIFNNEDLKEAFVSSIMSLPHYDPENPDALFKFKEEQERKEKEFFELFRNTVVIPEYLNNQPMIIADLIFHSKDLVTMEKEAGIKFVLKSFYKNHLTRIRLRLSFIKHPESVIYSEKWRTLIDKLRIEDIIECRNEDKYSSYKIPSGKKAIYIAYETIDNALIYPSFCSVENLNSYDFPRERCCEPRLISEKGKNGFNKYIAFAGYVDEKCTEADFELFQLFVHYERSEEIILLPCL